jgi:hypothetical protein
MSFSRQQWAKDFLKSLGNPSPTPAIVDWVVGWTVHETATGGGATYNLLNTTQRASGSWSFNSVGVQNYPNYAEGVQENAIVLGQNFPGYSALKQALVNNDISALNQPAASIKQGLKTWCGGCGYGVGFESLGITHLGDTFNYGNSSSVPAGSSGGTAPQTSTGGGVTTAPVGRGPCPSNIANIPLAGGIYCAGWDLGNKLGLPVVGKCNPWDFGCVLQQVSPALSHVAFRVALFVVGLTMFIIGFYLLASKAQDTVTNVVLDSVDKATSTTGQGNASGQGNQGNASKQNSSKNSKAEKAAKVAKLAEMAA